MVKFTHEQIERSKYVMDMVCKSPFSIPESDGIVIFDNAEEMGKYVKGE